MAIWTRRLEFASLTMTTWTPPISLLIIGLFMIFYISPTSVNARILLYFLIFIFLSMGITWNTRLGVGGRLWMTAFIHYLLHKETKEDIKTAHETWLALFFWPWLIIILITLFIKVK